MGLTFVREVEPHITSGGNKHRKALYRCDCGVEKTIQMSQVNTGKTKSCGCLNTKHRSEMNFKHGLSSHPLHAVWMLIKQRCYNPKSTGYKYWGGKGIKVCNEWLDDFKSFYDWAIVNGWNDSLQIDRRDNSGDYTPENCRCVTQIVNANNKSNNHIITANGVTHNAQEWASFLDINRELIVRRIRLGWTSEEALNMVPRIPKLSIA